MFKVVDFFALGKIFSHKVKIKFNLGLDCVTMQEDTFCLAAQVTDSSFQTSPVDHHGGEPHGRHLGLSLPGGGVRGRRVASEPLPALAEACMGLHAGQLHQVPDRHLGVSHCPRVHLLPALPARLPLPVHAIHAEIQDPAGLWWILLLTFSETSQVR